MKKKFLEENGPELEEMENSQPTHIQKKNEKTCLEDSTRQVAK